MTRLLIPATLLLLCGAVVTRADAPATSPADAALTESPADKRAAFLKLIDRPRAEPVAKEEASIADPEDAGLVRIGFSFASEPGERVPGLLLKRTQLPGKLPVVVVLHGTGGTKEAMLPHLRRFARRGYVAVAIDARYCGARSGGDPKAYAAAIAKAFADATDAPRAAGRRHPYLYDTVWDALRLLDYLETRHDVDAKRIGLIGFSKGGTEAYLAAAADDRVAAAVPCIGVQSFTYALENDLWRPRVATLGDAVEASAKHAKRATVDADFVRTFFDRVAPGLTDRFDGPAMLPLVAPRPMLVITGETDDRTPLVGVKVCAAAAGRAYAEARSHERFALLVQPGTGHKVTDEAMTAAAKWLEKHLKG